MILRVSLEKTRLRLLNLIEDVVSAKPDKWDHASLQTHTGQLGIKLAALEKPEAIFESERVAVSTIKSTGVISQVIRTFPSKRIIGVIETMLGMKAKSLFTLIAQAIMADPTEGALVLLGLSL